MILLGLIEEDEADERALWLLLEKELTMMTEISEICS